MTQQEWLYDWYNNRRQYERLGQAFCNDFIKHSWPELYYAEDDTALALIDNWLFDHTYFEEMPVKVSYD